MLEHINIDVLMNLVVMLRASVEGAILLSDDEEESRFYEGHMRHFLADSVQARSRPDRPQSGVACAHP